MTPITDRFISFIFLGYQRPSKKLAPIVANEMLEDIYEFTAGDDGLEEADGDTVVKPPLSDAERRQQSIEQLVFMFKAFMVVAIYAYSSYQKNFREKHQNFNDNNKGLSKVIDSMISKIM